MDRSFFTRLSATALFWAEALNRPKQVGAVAPSSRQLAAAVAQWLPANPRAWIVELGPGTGSVTRELLARGHAPNRLLAIEKSSKMAKLLRRQYPQSQVIEGDALDLDDLLAARGCQGGEVAVVFSGLPLVNFAAQTADRLAQKVFDVLQPGGRFVQFSYRLFRKHPEAVRRFESSCSRFVWMNIPPARISAYQKA